MDLMVTLPPRSTPRSRHVAAKRQIQGQGSDAGGRRGGQADAEAPEEGVLLAAKEGACAAAADEDGGSCSHWVGLVSGNLAARKDRGYGHLTLAFPMGSLTQPSVLVNTYGYGAKRPAREARAFRKFWRVLRVVFT